MLVIVRLDDIRSPNGPATVVGRCQTITGFENIDIDNDPYLRAWPDCDDVWLPLGSRVERKTVRL